MTLQTTDTDATTLAYLDPGVDILLALLKAGINSDLQPAWTDAATGTQLAGRAPVETTVPHEPTLDLMRSAKVKFPILCCHPTDEVTREAFTKEEDVLVQRWAIDYIMGPLTTEEVRKVGAALRYVQKIVSNICKTGGHTAYALDGNAVQAEQVLTGPGDDTCGFYRFKYINATRPGGASFGENSPTYWATRITCESSEPIGITTADADVAHVGGRFFFGTGTGVAADDGTGDDDNGIIEEQTESITAVT